MQQSQVKDIMTDEVVTVGPDATVVEVVKILEKHGFNGIPVVDQDSKLLGLVTEYNLITSQAILPSFLEGKWDQLESEAQQLSQKRVADIMETKPIILKFNDTFETALGLFNKHHRVNPIPVVDEANRLVGILSRYDMVKLIKLYGHT